MSDTWGADTPISMPDPPSTKAVVFMDGFAFGIDGMCHPLTEEEVADLATPTYSPGRR